MCCEKIIRRAITHGRLLGHKRTFLYQMLFAVLDLMKDAYPELQRNLQRDLEHNAGVRKRVSRTRSISAWKSWRTT